jgi:putative transposase
MQRAYKTELDPNNEQRTLLAKSVGVARFAWNWALGQIKERLDVGEKPESTLDLKKRLVALKSTELPWLAEVSKCCPEEALRNLNQAQQNFFRRLKRGDKRKGFPRFKRKGVHDSARLYGSIAVSRANVQLPRLGTIRLKECGYLPVDVPIINATISYQAGHWFVSILVEKPNEIIDKTGQPTVGVDLGIKTLATCSDGTRFENPRSLKRNLRK